MKKIIKVRIKVNIFVYVIMVLLISISYLHAHKSNFPQDKVDKVCLENRDKQVVLGTKKHTTQSPLHLEDYTRHIPRSRGLLSGQTAFSRNKDFDYASDKRDILYIGPGPDTFFIDTNYVQDDDIIIYGQGALLVDNAQLILSGHLYAQNQGQAIFRNNAHLHFEQYYVGQYYVWLVDSAKFEATDATVDANGVMHYAQLHDNSTYIATRTTFPDWTFRKIFDKSTLILEDVYHVGDLMVGDSCFIHFTRCDTLMPWFQAPDGSIIDIQFPAPDTVEQFEFSEATPGVDGIGYTFIADTCWQCWWSFETWPGCSVIVSNSVIRGSAIRIPGSDTFDIYGIADYNFYSNLIVPLSDRHLEYVNTYAYWWNWYPMENTVFNIDSCIFGEMIGRGNSETYATRCTHDGATISLSVEDSALVSFVDGIGQAFVSSWDRATLLMVNTSVIPLWPYQSTNLAHGHSYFLAVNSFFEYEPEAWDTSLVMVTAIDSPITGMVDTTIDIYGSAWIDVGPFNSITYDRYKLYWAYNGDTIWTMIHESLNQIHNDIIAAWNTAGMSEGDYDLRFTVWDDAGDSLTAFGDITLQAQGVNENKDVGVSSSYLQIYPNPFRQKTEISFQMQDARRKMQDISLEIYDVSGRIVKIFNLTSDFLPLASAVSWDGRDEKGAFVPSGIYFCQLQTGDFKSVKKLILVR
ncbi:T9SS type A sorting domain-containing protein [candidate division WOR-3 bacterium]|nr:T9SS type A sorting domain-containing protein [candidate division WOR-3 bacterium]